jgi:hypothetical protein
VQQQDSGFSGIIAEKGQTEIGRVRGWMSNSLFSWWLNFLFSCKFKGSLMGFESCGFVRRCWCSHGFVFSVFLFFAKSTVLALVCLNG